LKPIRDRAGRPVRLLVAGTGSLQQSYKAMVHDLGVADMVTFLGFRRDIADLIAAADALVLASVAEAFGFVLTEALYLGTPVVATRAGGIPEIVDDGVDGLLVPPADAEGLATAIVRLVQDDQLRRRIAGAGREKVPARFAFERMVRQYEQVYEECLSDATRCAHATSLSGHPEL
jgi:glycosyltransferase involved in cell wall biosynthesis